ncbi:MAG: ribosome biogenesis GTPase YlqF, partial [Oscillospiraceae bacterium]
MTEIPSIQWFPGHMTKTKRMIKASLPLVDAVVEILDARIPESSKNPDLQSLIEGKPRIVILNKCDTADESSTQKWISWYRNQGITAIAADCRSGRGLNKFVPAVKQVLADLIEKYESKGMHGRVLHLMVVG